MQGIEIRRGKPSDASFIIATWLNHYKNNSYFALRITRSTFFKRHHPIVSQILARASTETFVACADNDPDIILGFIVVEHALDVPVIHYSFVKEELRRLGIGKRLLHESKILLEDCAFTHWTWLEQDGSRFDLINEVKKKFPTLTYDPYRI